VATKRVRGERAGLDRDRILDAALDLVDRAGLPALTMRRLAAEVDVEAMTLYHYFPNKDALVDGIVERVFAATPAPVAGEDWATSLRRFAGALRETLLRHPGVLPVIVRPAVTPATLEVAEMALRALVDAGFPLGRAMDSINALTLFVVGHTAAEASIGAGDGPGSAAWLEGLDPSRYPLISEAARTGAGTDDVARFHYAVDALLAGFGRVARAIPSMHTQ
jgi:AcrR family transcriptional regulator